MSNEQKMVSVSREWLNRVATMNPSIETVQDEAIQLLCEPCDEPTARHQEWVECDDGLHLIQLNENMSHYGWVFRKVRGGDPYLVRAATEHEIAHAKARQHLRVGVAQISAQYQPATQMVKP